MSSRHEAKGKVLSLNDYNEPFAYSERGARFSMTVLQLETFYHDSTGFAVDDLAN